MHDPTLPTAISAFRVTGARDDVLVVRHDVPREPATGMRCDRRALRDVLGDAAPGWVALIPDATPDDSADAWMSSAMMRRSSGTVIVTAGPVTDAIKAVEPDGRIIATVDRDALRWARSPVLVRRADLLAALDGAADGEIVDPIALLADAGFCLNICADEASHRESGGTGRGGGGPT